MILKTIILESFVQLFFSSVGTLGFIQNPLIKQRRASHSRQQQLWRAQNAFARVIFGCEIIKLGTKMILRPPERLYLKQERRHPIPPSLQSVCKRSPSSLCQQTLPPARLAISKGHLQCLGFDGATPSKNENK